MKSLILLAALAASFHVNAVTFEKDNEAGGQIVLTDRPSADCKDGMKVAYGTSAKGVVLFGCWSLIDNRVWVTMGDTVRVHDPQSFIEKNNNKPIQRQSAPEKSTRM